MSEKSKLKILITGGCGKIGSYFVRFASDRYWFRIVDKKTWDERRLGPFQGESLVADLQELTACGVTAVKRGQLAHR